MLVWKNTKERNHNVFAAAATVRADKAALHQALVAMWSKVLGELDKRPAGAGWEILVVQFVTQCGSLYVYPASKRTLESKAPRFLVDLTVDRWATDYNKLPNADNTGRFNRAYARFHKARLNALKGSIQDEQLQSRFMKLKQRKSFAVFGVDEGEAFANDRMEFLWGNCPRQRQFKTSKALFEHTLRKAELTPEYSMRLRGDLVTGVNWFGEEFTDNYVTLLEEVPHLNELCAGLRDFMLTATRITPAGVKRLKQLLPQARFTVVSGRDYVSRGIDPWYKPRYLGGQEP